tara:strand:- start:1756 stop:2202 length:447 start_codon:yes stop_codon:yes gene_type:complete
MPSPRRTREISKDEATHTTIKTMTASGALTAGDSGKLVALDILGGTVAITLPAARVGLTYRIMVWRSDAGNDDVTIATAATTSLFKGGVVHLDITADENSLNVEADFSNDDLVTLVDPRNGTYVELFCDGTHWYLTGRVVSDTVPTIA